MPAGAGRGGAASRSRCFSWASLTASSTFLRFAAISLKGSSAYTNIVHFAVP